MPSSPAQPRLGSCCFTLRAAKISYDIKTKWHIIKVKDCMLNLRPTIKLHYLGDVSYKFGIPASRTIAFGAYLMNLSALDLA